MAATGNEYPMLSQLKRLYDVIKQSISTKITMPDGASDGTYLSYSADSLKWSALPVSTESENGVCRPDGSSITVNEDGTIKVAVPFPSDDVYTKSEVDALIQNAKEEIYSGLQGSMSINENGELVLDLPDTV